MICVIGYMGAGKSFISEHMEKHFNWKVADLDEYIMKQEGSTIPDLLQDSEAYFRKLESVCLAAISQENFDLVSLGGGAACSEKNMQIIKDKFTSIYLKWSPETLFNRLKNNKQNRPLIAHLSDDELKVFIEQSLAERSSYYNKADIVFDGDHQSIEELLTILSDYALRKG